LAQIMDRQSADLVLHAGDLIYGSVGPGNYARKFFRPYRNLLRRAFFYPVLGNHDLKSSAGQTFLEKFSLPADGPTALPPKHCFWFDYGDARFVGIDSNLDSNTLAGVVAPWLQDVLGAATCRGNSCISIMSRGRRHRPANAASAPRWFRPSKPGTPTSCSAATSICSSEIRHCRRTHCAHPRHRIRQHWRRGKSLLAERHGGAEPRRLRRRAIQLHRVRVDAGHTSSNRSAP
jgi:hypothetical protein